MQPRETLFFIALSALACGRVIEPEGKKREPEKIEPKGPRIEIPSTRPDPEPAPSAPLPAAPEVNDHGLCDKLCSLSAPLHCKEPFDCGAHCKEMYALETCQEPMRAALLCFSKVPTTEWQCDENGVPSVKEKHCDAEQAKVAECLQKQAH